MYFNAHNHSIYSSLDGHSLVDPYVAKLETLGHTHAVLTDHGTMSGLPVLWKACKDRGIIPVAGMEAYTTAHTLAERADEQFHLTLLAINETGYKNLMSLSSKAWLDGFYRKPRADHRMLDQFSEGIVCLSGCLAGELPQAILGEDDKRIHDLLAMYLEIYGDRFFLELQNHGTWIPDQTRVNKKLVELSRKHGIPAVGTNDSHFCNAEDFQSQQDLMHIIIKENKILGSPHTWVRNNEEMSRAFGDGSLLLNSLAISDRVEPYDLGTSTPRLPLSPWETGKTKPVEILRTRVEEGLLGRLHLQGFDQVPFDYELRMDEELNVIRKMGKQLGVPFERYFLNIGALADFMRRNQVRFTTRGSAAGSLVCWALGVSHIDPVANDLLFERFLNIFRVSLPDIDLDVDKDRRDDVLQHLQDIYETSNVARIGSYNRLAPRQALKDASLIVADQLSKDYKEIAEDLKAMIPHSQNPSEQTLAECLEPGSPLDQARSDPDYGLVINTAEKIAGRLRGQSIHAAGIVIADAPLSTIVPLMRVSDTSKSLLRTQTQYEFLSLEDIGLIKFDLLGLGELTKLTACLKLIDSLGRTVPDLDLLDWSDKDTWELIQSGDTLGLFQLSSRGMTRLLTQIQPQTIEELALVIALYRPGPMDNLSKIAARKHGKEPVESIHSSLDSILRTTYGIPVYQEQLIEIIVTVANYSRAEADEVRKAIGKKDTAKLVKHEKRIKKQGKANGYAEADVEAIWNYIRPFAAYGFNKSHAIAYAYAAFQSAWLKTHEPQAFYAAAMTVEDRSGGDGTPQERIGQFVLEARRRGVEIFPPHINHPTVEFKPEADGVRYGLCAIKDVGDAAARAITEASPFTSLPDLVERVPAATKRDLDALVKAGAIPWGNRPSQLSYIKDLLKIRTKQRGKPHKNESQEDAAERLKNKVKLLFAEASFDEQLPDDNQADEVWEELQILGMIHSDFPQLGFPVTCGIAELGDHLGRVSLVGMAAVVTHKVSKRTGNPYANLTLFDETGAITGMVWPKAWSQIGSVEPGSMVYIQGTAIVDQWDESSIPPPSVVQLRIDSVHVMKEQEPQRVEVTSDTAITISSDSKPAEILKKMGKILTMAKMHPGSHKVTIRYKSHEITLHVDPASHAQITKDMA